VVELLPVISSNIAAIGYDAPASALLVRFHDKSRSYRYWGVPISIYQAFLAAPSKGRFFAAYVRTRYAYERVA
jgi:hypothetical protein